MASLAPNRLPSAASSRRSNPSLQPSTKPTDSSINIYRHQHSLSTSTPSNQHFGSVFSQFGGPRSAGGPRQHLDISKSLAVNGPLSPRPGRSGLRPNSEALSASHLGSRTGSSSAHLNLADQSTEAEAIDRWFEDLQSYDTTLEEMAAASLDVNFKEELSAIEHWFRVLSEAERTAALYSLMQSSTQVQIRFFITVLQQMARSDPTTSLLSPAMNSTAPSMEQQMEAKLSQLKMKSPASPAVRKFAHQSLGPSVNVTSNDTFLSPHSALFNDPGSANEAVNSLSAQRMQLGIKSANRLSSPGPMISANSSLKSPKWGGVTLPLEEESQSGFSSPRPPHNELNQSQNSLCPTFTCTLHPSHSAIESQLSPIMGGSWASQVNTPLVPMFAHNDTNANGNAGAPSKSLTDTTNRLAQWGAAHQADSTVTSLASQTSSSGFGPSRPPANGFPLDDARKFRRQSKVSGASGAQGFPSEISGANSNTRHMSSAVATNNTIPPGLHHRSTNSLNTPRSAIGNGGPLPSPINTPSLGAQQAAEAAQQNWLNGLNNLSAAQISNTDPNVLNNLGLMNTLAAGLNGGMHLNGMANLAAMTNITDPSALQNMANLMNMRQQMQQVQSFQSLQQQLQQTGMLGSSMLSPHSARLGMNFSFPKMSGSPNGMSNKRSSGGRSAKPTNAPGSGSNPDEELDMKLLNDIPAWLRGLRLHKYTPNFAGCTWQEMVLMSDATLEARGVAAVGARRKMLRTFETVRIIKGMALPGDVANKTSSLSSNPESQATDQNSAPTNNAPPESDKDGVKNDLAP